MKKSRWFSKWLILPVILITMISTFIAGRTWALFNDSETSTGNTSTAWTSSQWTQTTQAEFDAGVKTNVDTATSPGDVLLPAPVTSYSPSGNTGNWTNGANGYSSNNAYATYTPSTTVSTRSPAANTGSAWTNPTNAYADGTGAATITSGNPSGSNVWGNYGFSLTGANITQVRVRYDAWSVGAAPIASMNPTANTDGTNPWTNPANGYTSNNSYATAVTTMPTYRSTGAVAYGPSAITPALPAGMSANDICIMVASTIAGGTVTITADGSITPWTAITGSPVDVTGGEKLYVWWGRYSSGSTAPSVQAGSDHIIARITAYYNVSTDANPIDVQETGTEETSDTSFSFATTISTTANNEMCISVCSTGTDSTAAQFTVMTNASLTALAERMDNCTTNGLGGGFAQDQGFKATAGTVGTWASTLTTASPKAYISFALKPASAGGGGFALAQGARVAAGTLGTWTSTLSNASPKAYLSFALLPTVPANIYDQIYGTFGFTGSDTITKVEVGYEAFATATQQLDIYVSTDGGSIWSSVHTTANLATSDPNAYTYIDVTADYSWTWTLLNDSNFKIKIVTNWNNATPTWSLDALVVRVTTATEYNDQIKVDVSWNGGVSWTATQNTTLTNAETTYWYDVTALAGGWTPAKLADGQLQVRALAQTVNAAEVVNLDWLPVEVTYYDTTTWSHTYGTYGISLTGDFISKVEVGFEAFAASSEKVELEVTWNNGGNWSSKQTSSALAGADPNSTTWLDFTSATSWTPTTLNDTNFKVRIWYLNNGFYGQVSLDYIPVKVTYRLPSGTIDSEVLYFNLAGSGWDGLVWDTTLPGGTSITIYVRAQDASFLKTDGSPSWTSIGGTSPVISGLPAGKYKQWRATLTTTNTSTPTLSEVRLYYDGGL